MAGPVGTPAETSAEVGADLDITRCARPATFTLPDDLSPLAGTITTHAHFTDDVVRVGLNYPFY